jgi:TOTE conflict system, Archaeo-Eukaryotic Primase domain
VRTVHQSLTLRDLERHLDGSGPRVGTHPLAQDSTTTRVVVDLDTEMPGLAQRIAKDLIAHELPAAIERSKSKGYHVWLFFERPIPGTDAQRLARYLSDRFTWVGEYFPRQDAISEKKPLGNFVFLPLYGRDVSEGRTVFLDVATLAMIEDQVGYLLTLPKATPEALARLLSAFKVTTGPGRNGQVSVRGTAWVRELLQQAGERHPTFTALAGRLIQRHVPAEDVEGILALVNRLACDPPKSEPAVYEEIHELVAWIVAQEQTAPESTDEDPRADRVVPPSLPEFPASAWRGPLAQWKCATDGTTEAPDAIRYAAILAPIAARIGRRVSLHYGTRLYPNVYIVGFGPTGSTRKTTASREARRAVPPSVRVIRGVGSGEALIEALQANEATRPVQALLEADELAVLLARAKSSRTTEPLSALRCCNPSGVDTGCLTGEA